MSKYRLLCFFILTTLSSTLFSISFAQEKLNLIYLKSGGKVIGRILEKQESQFVVVLLQAGGKITIQWDNIKTIDTLNVQNIDSTAFIERKIDTCKMSIYFQKQDIKYHNSIFFEAFGPGEYYSINYERFFEGNLSLRIGVSYLSGDYYSLDLYPLPILHADGVTFSYFVVPVMMNYILGDLIWGNACFKFELGAGFEYVHWKNYDWFWPLFNANNFLSSNGNPYSNNLLLIGSIGARYQSLGGRIQERLSITPMSGPYGHRWFFSFSSGYLF